MIKIFISSLSLFLVLNIFVYPYLYIYLLYICIFLNNKLNAIYIYVCKEHNKKKKRSIDKLDIVEYLFTFGFISGS